MLFITIIIVIHYVVSKVPLTKERKWEVQKRCCFDKNCSKWLFKLITTIEGRAGRGESLIVSVWAEIFHCKDFIELVNCKCSGILLGLGQENLWVWVLCCWQLLLIWRWQSPMKACQYSKYNFIIRIFTKTQWIEQNLLKCHFFGC